MNDGRADWNDALADSWQEEQSMLSDIEFEGKWWVRLLSMFLPEEVVYVLLSRV